jgi:uncharacterized protein (DUF58 family)
VSTEEFHYRVRWRTRGAFPGQHRALSYGDGFEFRNHIPLLRGGDPRRYDARASLRDPLERLLVRVHEQCNSIPVVALLDVSASMGFRGRVRKQDMMAEFVAALGFSAYRTGDPFGAIACDGGIREELVQPLSRVKGAGHEVASRLRTCVFEGASAEGLLPATRMVGNRRSLVFLVSDFHLPLPLIESVLGCLARHTVVPVALVDTAELSPAPGVWLVRVADPETGAQRTVLMRPALRERLRARFEERQAALTNLFTRHTTAPLWLVDRFRADQVTRYFFGG